MKNNTSTFKILNKSKFKKKKIWKKEMQTKSNNQKFHLKCGEDCTKSKTHIIRKKITSVKNKDPNTSKAPQHD